MFLWCGRRKRSTSSSGDAVTIQTPLNTSLLEQKEVKFKVEEQECMSMNPFRIHLVVEVMLEEAGVYSLKTLRKLDSNWNQLAIKELGKRALGDQLEPVNFSAEIPDAQEDFDQFLEYTAANPQLFRSFSINFPNSFKIIDPSIFTKYTPMFLHLQFEAKTQFPEESSKYLHNFFREIAPTLQELKVDKIWHPSAQGQVIKSPSNGPPLVFPKLTRIIWDMGEDHTDDKDHIPFQFILDKSGAVDPTPNLTTLDACINDDFLKMMNNGPNLTRWAQLTTLRVQEGCHNYLRFPATLLSLAQAGMRLKVFVLSLVFPPAEDFPEIYEIYKILTQFLATQAKSLQVLELFWIFCDDYASEESKILLPIFNHLHTLHLHLCNGEFIPREAVDARKIKMGQFRVHFPKVDHLRVNEQGLLNLSIDGEPVTLKSLTINGRPKDWQAWSLRIRSVETATCKSFNPWSSTDEIKALFSRHFPFHVKVQYFEDQTFPISHYGIGWEIED